VRVKDFQGSLPGNTPKIVRPRVMRG
jgi:hypothetical protein